MNVKQKTLVCVARENDFFSNEMSFIEVFRTKLEFRVKTSRASFFVDQNEDSIAFVLSETSDSLSNSSYDVMIY